MRNFFLSLLVFISFLQAHAQYPKVVIQFTDKGSNTFSLTNPSQYLSARALARRTKYNIAIDSTDLPVTQKYLDSVRLAGNVIILGKSKWLNQVLIQTTDNAALNKISSFPFVKAVKGVGFRVAGNNQTTPKFTEKIIPIINNVAANKTTADYFNYGSSYGQVHIHEGEFLHNKGYRGENINIAMLDAGFYQYKSVTAFDSMRNNNQVLGERDFFANDNSVTEDDSHGMYCLSIMAANWPGRMVGTAPKASYWLIRTENAPTEYPVEENAWVIGAEFADSTGADMISSSLGYTTFDDASFNHSYSDFYKNTTTISKGAALAVKKGMIVTISAGNDGASSWKYISFPADADSVCAVGAVDVNGAIASFSSYGYPGKVKPNIVSVGAGTIIAGYDNQPTSGNGTSFSNPNVAGLIACLWQAFPAYNNMKILDAVYRSANRFTAPTDRFGYGIPNFHKAYQLLKHDQNVALYGNNWLFATPDPFTTQIDITVIGQIDGSAKIELINGSNIVVATKILTTEIEEVYKLSFTNLDALPAGTYTIKYTDNTKSFTVPEHKLSLTNDNWLTAFPNPFHNSLGVILKAPETGTVALRLIDAKGSKVDEVSLTVTQGDVRPITFKNIVRLQRGIYTIEYISTTQKKSFKLLKQ